jgi:heme/copper-type cytochrome/quinol oxidase subunit 2
MMKIKSVSPLRMIIAFSVPIASCLPIGQSLAQTQDVQVIAVSAKKYEYSPAPIHIKKGTKVQLKITATDHDHGFKIADLPDGSTGATPGLVFAAAQDCWQLKKEKQPRSSL